MTIARTHVARSPRRTGRRCGTKVTGNPSCGRDLGRHADGRPRQIGRRRSPARLRRGTMRARASRPAPVMPDFAVDDDARGLDRVRGSERARAGPRSRSSPGLANEPAAGGLQLRGRPYDHDPSASGRGCSNPYHLGIECRRRRRRCAPERSTTTPRDGGSNAAASSWGRQRNVMSAPACSAASFVMNRGMRASSRCVRAAGRARPVPGPASESDPSA